MILALDLRSLNFNGYYSANLLWWNLIVTYVWINVKLRLVSFEGDYEAIVAHQDWDSQPSRAWQLRKMHAADRHLLNLILIKLT